MDSKDSYFVASTDMTTAASAILHSERWLSNITIDRPFRTVFVAPPNICALLWVDLGGLLRSRIKPNLLLWGLPFLKCMKLKKHSPHMRRLQENGPNWLLMHCKIKFDTHDHTNTKYLH